MIGRLTPKAPSATQAAPPDGDRFDVEFSRSDGRYRVVVRATGSHGGVRALDDSGTSCASLSEATALTIALIVDPEGVKLEPPASDPEPTTPPPPVTTVPDPARDTREADASATRPSRWSLAIAARAGAAVGVVREVAPIATLAVELRPLRWVSLDIGAIFIPVQSLELRGGTVDVWLAAGTANACFWPYAEAVRLGGCIGLAGGAIRGDGRGYPVEGGSTRPWLAGTATGAADGPIFGPLGWSVRGGLVVPTHRESFGVDGAGVAYEALAIGAIVSGGLTVQIR